MHSGTPSIIRDVVGDDVTGTLAVSAGFGSHGHLPEEQWWVLVNLSGENLGEQSRLQFQATSICYRIAEERMAYLFVESLLKVCEENLTLLIFEPVRP